MTGAGAITLLQGLWLLWLALFALGVAGYVFWPGNRVRFAAAGRLALDRPASGAERDHGEGQTNEQR